MSRAGTHISGLDNTIRRASPAAECAIRRSNRYCATPIWLFLSGPLVAKVTYVHPVRRDA